MRRIGVDVGGTNTDAVLLEDGRVVHAVKTPTTEDVTGGIVAALELLGCHPQVAHGAIDGVVIGTTHFVNAVVQRRHLTRVAAIRIGLPASASLPPFCDWPADLAALVEGAVFMLEGGHDYDGRPIMPFDEAGMRRAARQIRDSFTRAVAIMRDLPRSSLNGAPMAKANWPTRTASLSANCTTGKFVASILMTATSVFSSVPTTFAWNSRPSFSFTSIRSASSRT